jgi:hypothetical protein
MPEPGCSDVIIQKLYSDKFLSLGVLTFPSGTEKENCVTESHNMVSI